MESENLPSADCVNTESQYFRERVAGLVERATPIMAAMLAKDPMLGSSMQSVDYVAAQALAIAHRLEQMARSRVEAELGVRQP